MDDISRAGGLDAGFVDAPTILNPGIFGVSGLTWRGHEFLDSIRDPEIWRRTKEAAKKAGGSTFEFLWDIAKAILKTEIAKHTGSEL